MRDTGRDGSGEEDEDVVFIDFLLFSRQLFCGTRFRIRKKITMKLQKYKIMQLAGFMVQSMIPTGFLIIVIIIYIDSKCDLVIFFAF